MAALVFSTAALLLATPVANAWPWSSSVYIAGHVTCTRGVGLSNPKQIYINAYGQAPSAGFSWANNYGLNIGGVSGSQTGRADILCRGLSGDYWFSRNINVYRPGGPQINQDFSG